MKFTESIKDVATYDKSDFTVAVDGANRVIDSLSVVNGDVKLKLFKGNVIILGRRSKNSLYDLSKVSFENNDKSDQKLADEFIKSQFNKIN